MVPFSDGIVSGDSMPNRYLTSFFRLLRRFLDGSSGGPCFKQISGKVIGVSAASSDGQLTSISRFDFKRIINKIYCLPVQRTFKSLFC